MLLLANGEGQVGVAAAVTALREGHSALDAVEAGIREVERDTGVHTVGRGGKPNLLGQVECDAAIMDGSTLAAGAVGALQGYLFAVTVARRVMQDLPHVLLVGEGAARFAGEIGATTSEMLTEESAAEHNQWMDAHVPLVDRRAWPDVPLAPHVWTSAKGHGAHGTTVYLAVDRAGNLAGGASTSGWSRKYPGRLGDSSIIGAGLYADTRYGACGCTHTGEMAMRALTARSVVLYMQHGAPVADACHTAAQDLQALCGGHLGPLVIHAMDREGHPYVLSTHELGEKIDYCFWSSAKDAVQHCRPVIATANGKAP